MIIKFSKKITKQIQTVVLPVLVVFSIASHANASQEAEVNNPKAIIEQATTATFNRIESDKLLIAENPNHLRLIIEQELMPHIDHKFAAFKVLGTHFRSVPKEQIPVFIEEFRQYLVSNFAVSLANYGGQSLIFDPIKYNDKATHMNINALIRDANRPDIHLQFKLRKTGSEQEWKTYDLAAEGVSLLASKQSEFASIIRVQGIQGAITLMQNKNKEPLSITATAD